MGEVVSVMIAGVGGQGTVLASKILSLVAMKAGLDVKQSEIHGMSQRGGSVVTHVRFGEKVYSPLVSAGCADFAIAFEELEALRCLPYLKKEGLFIVNTQQMLPMPVITGAAVYPADPVGDMLGQGLRVAAVDASGIGQEKGDARAANLVLLGVLAESLDIPEETWHEAIKECMRPNLLEMNMAAFRAGQEAGAEGKR
ncbi:MAG: indolepyruvate oxidoreductase subunit beta [Clostridiales bacterium]|nr:indolepyruvate oxidoreductase subunit beta [Clostridiales bacterium]